MLKHFVLLFFVLLYLPLMGQNVYTTKSGEKYHKEACHYLKNSKMEMDLSKAIEKGYTACKVCKPTKTSISQGSANKIISSSNTLQKTNVSSQQCTSKTKAGKRCLRMTKNSNGRCYQHQ